MGTEEFTREINFVQFMDHTQCRNHWKRFLKLDIIKKRMHKTYPSDFHSRLKTLKVTVSSTCHFKINYINKQQIQSHVIDALKRAFRFLTYILLTIVS